MWVPGRRGRWQLAGAADFWPRPLPHVPTPKTHFLLPSLSPAGAFLLIFSAQNLGHMQGTIQLSFSPFSLTDLKCPTVG